MQSCGSIKLDDLVGYSIKHLPFPDYNKVGRALKLSHIVHDGLQHNLLKYIYQIEKEQLTDLIRIRLVNQTNDLGKVL